MPRIPTIRLALPQFGSVSPKFGVSMLLGVVLSLAIAACNSITPQSTTTSSTPATTASPPAQQEQVIRIGYQKSASVLNYLRSQGNLEKRFAPEGVKVEWSEFAATPQLLEAMTVGSVDFTFGSGVAGIVAQAGEKPIVRVAYEPFGANGSGILIPKDSPVKTVADLKGKKVAITKATGIQFVLILALEKAGLKYSDIQSEYLTPADARTAFEGGSVDAWGMWNPVYTQVQQQSGAKVLVDGQGLSPGLAVYYASAEFVKNQPERLQVILSELNKTNLWASQHRDKIAEFLSPILGIDLDILKVTEQAREYSGVKPIDDILLQEQKQIADKFNEIGLIPKKIDVFDVAHHWKPDKSW